MEDYHYQNKICQQHQQPIKFVCVSQDCKEINRFVCAYCLAEGPHDHSNQKKLNLAELINKLNQFKLLYYEKSNEDSKQNYINKLQQSIKELKNYFHQCLDQIEQQILQYAETFCYQQNQINKKISQQIVEQAINFQIGETIAIQSQLDIINLYQEIYNCSNQQSIIEQINILDYNVIDKKQQGLYIQQGKQIIDSFKYQIENVLKPQLINYQTQFNLQTFQGKIKCQLQEHQDFIYCVKMLNEIEGYFATGSGDQMIKIWKLNEQKIIRTLQGHTGDIMCLEEQNSYLFSGSRDHNIKQWNWTNGQLINTFIGHTDCIRQIICRNNIDIISCSDDDSIKFWNTSKKENQSYKKLIHENCAFSIILNKNTLYSFGYKNNIKVWDLENNKCIKSIDTNQSLGRSILISDDFIMISAKESILLFNIKTYNIEQIINTQKYYLDIFLRPFKQIDSNHIIITNCDPEILNLYNTQNKKQVLSLVGHKDGIFDVLISTQYNIILSVSRDNNIIIWE